MSTDTGATTGVTPTPAADADAIAAAVLACPSVAGLGGGPAGAVATYLPGRRVTGVRVRPDGPAGQVGGRTGRRARGRPLRPDRGDPPEVPRPSGVAARTCGSHRRLLRRARPAAPGHPMSVGSPLEHRSPVMVPSLIGLFVGLVLGLAAAFGGVTALVVVAFLQRSGSASARSSRARSTCSRTSLVAAGPGVTTSSPPPARSRRSRHRVPARAARPDVHRGPRGGEDRRAGRGGGGPRDGAARRILGVGLGTTSRATPARVVAQVEGGLVTVEVSLSVVWPALVRAVTREVRRHLADRVHELAGLRSRRSTSRCGRWSSTPPTPDRG